MAELNQSVKKSLQDIVENKTALSQSSPLAQNKELVSYVKELLNGWAHKQKITGWQKLEGDTFDEGMKKALVAFGKKEGIDIQPEKLGFRALGRLLVSSGQEETLAGISALTQASRGETVLYNKSAHKERNKHAADLVEGALNAWVKSVGEEIVFQTIKNSKEKIDLNLEELKSGLNAKNKDYDAKFSEFVKAFQLSSRITVDGKVGPETLRAARKYIDSTLKNALQGGETVTNPPAQPAPDPNLLEGGVKLGNGLVRTELTLEAAKWAKKQQDIVATTSEKIANPDKATDPKFTLVDASRFLSEATEKEVMSYLRTNGVRESVNGVTLHTGAKGDLEGLQFEINGTCWMISESPWYRDQYPKDRFPNGPDPKHLVLTKVEAEFMSVKRDYNTQISFDMEKVFKSDGTFDPNAVRELTREAESNRASEKVDSAKVKDLDMKGTVGYIGLIQKSSDPVLDGLNAEVAHMPGFLNSLNDPTTDKPRYNIVTLNGSESISVERDPAAILRENLLEMKKREITTFRINLAGHGDERGVHFGKNILSPQQLQSIFNDPEFRNCKFIIDTVACHGGNFASLIENYQDPTGEKGRIQVKLQTKAAGLNQEGRLLDRDPPTPHSTYYNIYFTAFMAKGMKEGAAHLAADMAAKRLVTGHYKALYRSP